MIAPNNRNPGKPDKRNESWESYGYDKIIRKKNTRFKRRRRYESNRNSKKLEIKQTAYSRYELDKNEIPLHHIIKLAKIYDVSMDYICGLTDERRPFPKS